MITNKIVLFTIFLSNNFAILSVIFLNNIAKKISYLP